MIKNDKIRIIEFEVPGTVTTIVPSAFVLANIKNSNELEGSFVLANHRS